MRDGENGGEKERGEREGYSNRVGGWREREGGKNISCTRCIDFNVDVDF